MTDSRTGYAVWHENFEAPNMGSSSSRMAMTYDWKWASRINISLSAMAVVSLGEFSCPSYT